jgi:hypothetical protein
VVTATAEADRAESGESASVGRGPAARLGVQPGQAVLEIGYDDDCDEDVRAAVEELTGSELLHESAGATSYYSSGDIDDDGDDVDDDSDVVSADAGDDGDEDDEAGEEAVDVVLLWWREDDGDLVDALVDALVSVVSGGTIWLLTPKIGRDGYVDPADIADAAPTAGLAATSTLSVSTDWSGSRLMAPKARR